MISHSNSVCYSIPAFHIFTVIFRNHVVFRIVFSTRFVEGRGETMSTVCVGRGGSVTGGRYGFQKKITKNFRILKNEGCFCFILF